MLTPSEAETTGSANRIKHSTNNWSFLGSDIQLTLPVGFVDIVLGDLVRNWCSS